MVTAVGFDCTLFLSLDTPLASVTGTASKKSLAVRSNQAKTNNREAGRVQEVPSGEERPGQEQQREALQRGVRPPVQRETERGDPRLERTRSLGEYECC